LHNIHKYNCWGILWFNWKWQFVKVEIFCRNVTDSTNFHERTVRVPTRTWLVPGLDQGCCSSSQPGVFTEL